jgi:alpha-1,6-mannosyltransferase
MKRIWDGAARWRVGHAWMTNAVLCGIGLALLLLAKQFVVESDHFVIGFSGVSGWSATLYVAAVIVILTQPVNRWTLWIVLGFAIAYRFMVLFADPFLSSDIYRYSWDGVVQHAHISPYRYVPGDPVLTFLREPNQDLFNNINRRDYAHTIYPPVAQMIYWLVTFFSGDVTAMKLAMAGFECVTVAALMALLRAMGRAREEVLLYAWCPLCVWEIGGSGHVDAAVIAFVALALWTRYRGWAGWTGLLLGLAVMTKFYPLVLLPALWMRREGKFGGWKMPAALLSVVVAGYAVYSSAGKLVFGFLGGYAKEEGLNTGERFFLLDWMHQRGHWASMPEWVFLALVGVAGVAMSVWAWKYAAVERFRDAPAGTVVEPKYLRASMGMALLMMLAFSPHYPWYILWLIPLFTLRPNVVYVTYVMAFFYGFTTALADPGPKMFLLNEYLYGAVVAAMVVQAVMWKWPVLRWWNPRGVVHVQAAELG